MQTQSKICTCLPSLEDSLCSLHGRPWQENTWTAWRAWMQIGYSSKRLMLTADCLRRPPSHGDPAMKISCTTTLCHRHINTGYASQPYIQQSNNRRLQKIIAQFRTGSHWLQIETGRHKKLEKEARTCPMCASKLINPGLPPELWDARR